MVVNKEKSNLIHNEFSDDMIQKVRDSITLSYNTYPGGIQVPGFFFEAQ